MQQKWIDYHCAKCGEKSASISFEQVGETYGMSHRDSPVGDGWEALSKENFEKMYAMRDDPEALLRQLKTPQGNKFFCDHCQLPYCKKCWRIQVIYADDHPSWYEKQLGTCPQGHTVKLDD